MAAHPSKAGAEYEAALEVTHQQCADRLLQLCQVARPCRHVVWLFCYDCSVGAALLMLMLLLQMNGSLYIKAAQFATTIPSVPAPYRRYRSACSRCSLESVHDACDADADANADVFPLCCAGHWKSCRIR